MLNIFTGFDGAGSHPQNFDKESIKLSKAGHSLKACQTFAIIPITCSTAVENDVRNMIVLEIYSNS